MLTLELPTLAEMAGSHALAMLAFRQVSNRFLPGFRRRNHELSDRVDEDDDLLIVLL